jgi:hypothetical protein
MAGPRGTHERPDNPCMNDDPIPSDVSDFLTRYIDSIAQLEALLLLRHHPEPQWTAQEVAKRLYISEQQTAAILARLAEDRLVEWTDRAAGRVVYRPGSAALAEVVDRVAEAYRRHLVPITNLVHGKVQTRVQKFADAFKLRKEE